MKNKKRKLKKTPFIFIGVIIVFIITLIFIIKTINYHKTYNYKLEKLGYTETEINHFIKNLKEELIDNILSIKYDENIYKITKEKYFLEKNLKKYLAYQEENNDKTLTDIVAIINVRANEDWYNKPVNSNIENNYLLIVNKFYKLPEDYEPDDLQNVSSVYSFGSNQKLRKEAFSAFKSMFTDAKEEGLYLIINSSYRSYTEQEEIYNEIEDSRGKKYADSIAARPGHSEHQTGLAMDIQTYNSTASTFETFDEFKWLQDNAHKYGFILRYPKDKEYLTGYDYESWHYRYVGVDVATYIYENNITYDEYFAYFLN